jgi:hypothetical protein
MNYFAQPRAILAAGLLCAFAASATSVPRLSFEQLTDRSELVVSGQISRSWADWDSSHHFIWTHYELAVSGVHKGAAGSSVVLSEPGGVVGGMGQTIAGSVQYAPGEKVVIFLEREPNGYLRTTGWSQGKFTVDSSGHVHGGGALAGVELIQTNVAQAVRDLPVDGITTSELAARVSARVRSQQNLKGVK